MSESLDLMPRTRRGWVVSGVVVAMLVVAFLTVVRFYDVEGGIRVDGGLGATDATGVIVTVEPVSVDALRGTAQLHLTFDAQGSDVVGTDVRLTKNTRITIGSESGLSEVLFPAGSLLGQYEATIGLDGEQADYPFDVHAGYFAVAVDTYEQATDGSVTSTTGVPVGLQGRGGVNGWNTGMTLAEGMTEAAYGTVTFNRAFSTQVFAILILVMAAVLAALALMVGILAHSRRRVVEATLLSWTAALIFALPALRGYMPNSPPIGASIDIYVFLWVMVAAVAAACLVALAWMEERKPPTVPVPPTGQNAPYAT